MNKSLLFQNFVPSLFISQRIRMKNMEESRNPAKVGLIGSLFRHGSGIQFNNGTSIPSVF